MRETLKNIRDTYGVYFFVKHPKMVLTTHSVNVYDPDGNFIYIDHLAHKNVVKIVRWPHKFGNTVMYSFNEHFNNGLQFWGMIPDPGFDFSEFFNSK